MLCKEFQICLHSSGSNNPLEFARSMLVSAVDPIELRDVDTQRMYVSHRLSGGEGIMDSWQVNKFPYTRILRVLNQLTGEGWLHMVYATDHILSLPLLMWEAELNFAQLDNAIGFMNKPEHQTQSKPHGHLILPTRYVR